MPPLRAAVDLPIRQKVVNYYVSVCTVDAFGQPARLDVIREIADRHGLVVIEDSCWDGGRSEKVITK